ncbi:hypothetical protein ACROYT_G010784 [Oculina patagonica]
MLVLDANGNYNVSWNFNASSDTLEFLVEVRGTGWVSFGVAKTAPNNMMGYDVAIGGVMGDGTGYLKDYLTIGKPRVPIQFVVEIEKRSILSDLPELDHQQDWMLSDSSEENGTTTLRFYRKLNTADQQSDVVIQQGMSIFVLWAYHSTTDFQFPECPQHTARGFQKVTFIPDIVPTNTTLAPTEGSAFYSKVATSVVMSNSASQQESVAPTNTSTSPTTTATSTPTTTQFTHSFDNNRFRFLWKFDDQNDKIFYHLRVKTTGWVGFGFATNAPNNMQNYDVIVGGFKDGQGYLNDYHTQGRFQPQPDANQDYKLLSASEPGGYTELMFERKRDTGDINDIHFETDRQVHIIWAYADKDIRTVADFAQHSNQGWSDETFVMVPEAPFPTQAKAAKASSLHLTIYGTVIITIVFLAVLCM